MIRPGTRKRHVLHAAAVLSLTMGCGDETREYWTERFPIVPFLVSYGDPLIVCPDFNPDSTGVLSVAAQVGYEGCEVLPAVAGPPRGVRRPRRRHGRTCSS